MRTTATRSVNRIEPDASRCSEARATSPIICIIASAKHASTDAAQNSTFH